MQRSYLYRNNSIDFVLRMTTRRHLLLISILLHFSSSQHLLPFINPKKMQKTKALLPSYVSLPLSLSLSLSLTPLNMFLSLFIFFSSLVLVTFIPLQVCSCRQPARAESLQRAPVVHRRGRTGPRWLELLRRFHQSHSIFSLQTDGRQKQGPAALADPTPTNVVA